LKAWFVHVFTREYFLLDIYFVGGVKRCCVYFTFNPQCEKKW